MLFGLPSLWNKSPTVAIKALKASLLFLNVSLSIASLNHFTINSLYVQTFFKASDTAELHLFPRRVTPKWYPQVCIQEFIYLTCGYTKCIWEPRGWWERIRALSLALRHTKTSCLKSKA